MIIIMKIVMMILDVEMLNIDHCRVKNDETVNGVIFQVLTSE